MTPGKGPEKGKSRPRRTLGVVRNKVTGVLVPQENPGVQTWSGGWMTFVFKFRCRSWARGFLWSPKFREKVQKVVEEYETGVRERGIQKATVNREKKIPPESINV